MEIWLFPLPSLDGVKAQGWGLFWGRRAPILSLKQVLTLINISTDAILKIRYQYLQCPFQ